jgi:hypothetical protein
LSLQPSQIPTQDVAIHPLPRINPLLFQKAEKLPNLVAVVLDGVGRGVFLGYEVGDEFA